MQKVPPYSSFNTKRLGEKKNNLYYPSGDLSELLGDWNTARHIEQQKKKPEYCRARAKSMPTGKSSIERIVGVNL